MPHAADNLILAIDQGTTSSRAMAFARDMSVVAQAGLEFPQYFPRSGWVEHDADEIWKSVETTCRTVLDEVGAQAVAAIGITNQRETVVLWDRATGEPVHKAIVWQDRRTAPICEELKAAGHEPLFTERTGLLLDPYFSGTKVRWLLDEVPGLRARADAGEIAFGTVDSWLIWKLTDGARHVSDATNAARTLMFDIARNDWDDELLDILGVPRDMLPEVLDSAADFGTTALFGRDIPILGVAGDQQAATIGNACFEPGMVKSTYGTGCFALLNTGGKRVPSANRMLTTIAYRLDGETTYALEGSIFMAGATVQWLRDAMGLIATASKTGDMAAAADPGQDVVLVPAFTGLGAPHWDADARAAMFGMTRATGPNEFARAALEAVCFQTVDLLEAMAADYGQPVGHVLRVDGGMVASDWTMQRLADLLDAPVDRPILLETTALGAAWLAGHRAGLWPDRAGFAEAWRRERRFEPAMGEDTRRNRLASWRDAVSRTLSRSAT